MQRQHSGWPGLDWLDRWEFSGGLSSGGTPISGFRFALEGSMPLAEQQEPRWDGSWPKVGAREVQRGICPLQNSCLENPRNWGAWWAAIYGVAQSRTRLKRLSSSSI